MFRKIEYLNSGNNEQRRVYKTIINLEILNDLSDYSPVLCGTFPIGINIESSDLDIILEVTDFEYFEKKVRTLYGDKENFILKKLSIRNFKVIKANFNYEGFEFELFGQFQPVYRQFAFLHMIIEQNLLEENPSLRQEVIRLKQNGLKTEPAFCEILEIKGDPYENLIKFGIAKGIIDKQVLL
ncbi:MAG: DUF4269 domain-containing protein [Paenisporosarcina sp.]